MTIKNKAPQLQSSSSDMRDMLATMILIRSFEERVYSLYQEGLLKGTAHSSIGQEAIAAGACKALRIDDFILSHHRGHGHCIAKGAKTDRMMAELMGKVDGYCSGFGGSMHIADLDLQILGANGIVGASMGLGLGAALKAQMAKTNQIGISFFGDGAANEGIFHESLNIAALWKLPLIFFCENNQYGLSMPAAEVTAGKSIAARANNYGVLNKTIDGNDVSNVYLSVSHAANHARSGLGPVLIEARTYRLDDHNMRPSWPRYRTQKEEISAKENDPIERCVSALIKNNMLTDTAYRDMIKNAQAEINSSVNFAIESPDPDIEKLNVATTSPIRMIETSEPSPGERKISYIEAINEAIAQEMKQDEKVFVIGEDIAKIGGVFGVTRGLRDKYGPKRIIDTPISENAIAGTAVGAALAGYRPIAEIQIFDFVTHMMDMIVNQAAKLRFMLGGKATIPAVFRGPQGGGVRLAAQHSQSLESWFTHIPGLVVLAPSNPYDAKGLMVAAIRDNNPCIFLEHKMLYLGQKQEVPKVLYEIPIGKADVKREGQDVTIIATLSMVDKALQASDTLIKNGVSLEVIDPRTLRPLDYETILNSVKKTNRCIVVHEAWRTGGLGAEIAAEISERAFDWLDAPVMRLGSRDVPMPFNSKLERAVIPSVEDIIVAATEICR